MVPRPTVASSAWNYMNHPPFVVPALLPALPRTAATLSALASVTSEVHSVKPRRCSTRNLVQDQPLSTVPADCAHLSESESESDVRMKMPSRAPSRAAQSGPASMTCLVFGLQSSENAIIDAPIIGPVSRGLLKAHAFLE